VKIKETPADFVVKERYDLTAVATEGPIAVYKVEKVGISTIDAAVRLAEAAGVATDAVRFAGLKDKHATTVQAMSVEGGRPADLREEGLRAELLGYAAEPVTSERLIGNEFSIVVRDLAAAEAEGIASGIAAVMRSGLPNYFDDQRFGAARSGKGFPARELVKCNEEEALRLLVAAPATIDSPEHSRRREELAAAWGDFKRCLTLARGWHEQAVFRHLAREPQDFRGALRFVPRRERLMQLFAYQSLLWNRALDKLVRARHGAAALEIPTELAPLAAWRALDPKEMEMWESTALPLPCHSTKPNDPVVRGALEAACAVDGVSLDRLRIRGIRGFEFREDKRACVLIPDEAEIDEAQPDDRHAGRVKLRVQLSLPKGAYATLVLKRAAAENPGR
jgi:tRNA pseudouridine13 synthase